MFKPTFVQVLEVMQSLSHKVYDDGSLNLVGIRRGRTMTNKFDDTFVCWTTPDDFVLFGCTTDPGAYWMLDKLGNAKGTAVLKPGQFFDSHKRGLHKGRYAALVQARPLTVYRDNNKDKIYDYENPDTGIFGINIHRANAKVKSVQVDNWSAGCTVIADPKDFAELMRRANRQKKDVFTYTLIEKSNF